jgi:putative molybdopterin biosynthesis protein
VAIEWVARSGGLGFLPLEDEQYDLVVPKSRLHRPAVVALGRLLGEPAVRRRLAAMGFRMTDEG